MTLFSTYSTGENRVTGSILAVLEVLSWRHTQRILSAVLGASELQLLSFVNQASSGGAGVPDAVISGSFRLMIETKTARNAVDLPQLQRHLKKLSESPESRKLLLVLTPDAAEPAVVASLQSDLVVWAKFGDLHQAIDDLLKDITEVVPERDAFLLRELQLMLKEEGLLVSDDVLVVAARWAYDEYLKTSAYVCQAHRSFRNVKRIAFYRHGRIEPEIATIDGKPDDDVEFRLGAYDGRKGAVVHALVGRGMRQEGQVLKIVYLTPPDDPETIRLNGPVVNDSKSGDRPIAFTQGQRYVSLEKLKKAKKTSDLT